MTQPLALLLSIISESIAAWVLVGACGWGSAWRAGLAAVLGTLVTHWAAWWSIIGLTGMIGYAPAVAAVESFVVLVEAIAYSLIVPLPSGRALLVSLVANGASTALALALYALGLA